MKQWKANLFGRYRNDDGSTTETYKITPQRSVYGSMAKQDAQLASAAPDLLRACQSAEQSIVDFMGCRGYGKDSGAQMILEEVREAIAKAKGEIQ